MGSERNRLGLGVSLLMMGTAVWLVWPVKIAIDRRRTVCGRTVQRRRRARARVLVVGDGVAIVAGDHPSRATIAGRVAAAHPDWTVGNLARRGHRTADVARVLGRLARRLERAGSGAAYDAVIVHAGGRDARRFTREGPLSVALAEALASSASVARHTLLVSDHDPTLASIWPWSRLFAWRRERVRSLFRAIAWEAGVGYVDASSPDGEDAVVAALGSRLSPSSRSSRLPAASAESLLHWDE